MTAKRLGELAFIAAVVLALVLYCWAANGCGTVYAGCPRYNTTLPLDCGACH